MTDSKPPFTAYKHKGEISRHVNYDVRGFWSGGAVRVNQNRDLRLLEWQQPEIGWSAGGRDYKAEPDDTIAAECFAKAVLAAVKQARQWQSQGGAE